MAQEQKFFVSPLTVDLNLHLKTIQVHPLPLIEEIWENWTDGKPGLMKFNERAALGIDHYFSVSLNGGEGDDAEQAELHGQVFDKTQSNGFKELDELMAVIHKVVLQKVFPVTCCST